MAKKKTKQEAEPVSFEQSVLELQQIVGDLEGGTLGLDESLERLEQGMGLLKNCRELLDGAERRVQLLTGFDSEGNPITEDFDASSSADASQPQAGRRRRSTPAAADDSDEEESGQLF